jgi:hypothetical protein
VNRPLKGPLETRIEKKGEETLALAGFYTIKMGWDGLPDRIVFRKGSDRVFWIEYKTLDGAMSALQKARGRDLVEKGHRVYVVRTHEELDRVIERELLLARQK